MKLLETGNPNQVALVSAEPRHALSTTLMSVVIVALAWSNTPPFDGADAFIKIVLTAIAAVVQSVYSFGRFGTDIDRESGVFCNWYELFGFRARWVYRMSPVKVRLEYRFGGHRDESELTYIPHLFLINRYGPPFRIGRFRRIHEGKQAAVSVAHALGVPFEEGGFGAAEQVCVPAPWAFLTSGMPRSARVIFSRRRVSRSQP